MNTKSERNTNFEILRILTMLFIIGHHFSIHGNISTIGMSGFNYFWYNFLLNGGKLGVIIFMLISGYFLSASKKYKSSKALGLFLQVLIYANIMNLIFTIFTGNCETSYKAIACLIIPFSSYCWPFVTQYIIVLLLSPFLNKIINTLTKKQYIQFLIVLGAVLVVGPTFSTLQLSSDFLILLYAYLIAGYIRRYNVSLPLKPAKGLFYFLAFYSLLTGLRCSLMKNNLSYLSHIFNISDVNNMFCVLLSMLVFLSFKNMKPKYNKKINILSKAVFGVFLIHDFYRIRNFLWFDLFKNSQFATSPYFAMYAIFVIALVFTVCIIISLIYNYTIGKLVDKFVKYSNDKYLYKIDNFINNTNKL